MPVYSAPIPYSKGNETKKGAFEVKNNDLWRVKHPPPMQNSELKINK